jgi:hypothetical protein
VRAIVTVEFARTTKIAMQDFSYHASLARYSCASLRAEIVEADPGQEIYFRKSRAGVLLISF